jgi:predicted RNase H-like nuclease
LGYPRKATWNGFWERHRLLAKAGIQVPAGFLPVATAGPDDVLDAAVMAWTAQRIGANVARSLPAEPPLVSGRRVAIWY